MEEAEAEEAAAEAEEEEEEEMNWVQCDRCDKWRV